MANIRRFNGSNAPGSSSGPRVLGTTARFGVESAATNVIANEFGWTIDAPPANPPIPVDKRSYVWTRNTLIVPTPEYITFPSPRAFVQTELDVTPTNYVNKVVGPIYFTTPASTSYGLLTGTAWTNPANANVNDGSYATVSPSGSVQGLYFDMGDLDIIPRAAATGSKVTGIEVKLYGKSSWSTSSPPWTVYLGTHPNDFGSGSKSFTFATNDTFELKTLGGSTDTWGAVAEDLTLDTFLGSLLVTPGVNFSPTHTVDYVSIKVWYKTDLLSTIEFEASGSTTTTSTTNYTGSGTPTVDWTDPGNAGARDGVAATCVLTTSALSYALEKSIADFDIPLDATITHAVLTVSGSDTGGGAATAYLAAKPTSGGTITSVSGNFLGGTFGDYEISRFTLDWTPGNWDNNAKFAFQIRSGVGTKTVNLNYFWVHVFYTIPLSQTTTVSVRAYTQTRLDVVVANRADTGWVSPTAHTTTGLDWTNPGNAYSSNDTYATATLGAGGAVGTNYHTFGFSVPTGRTILGVEARFEAKQSATDTNIQWTVQLATDANVAEPTNLSTNPLVQLGAATTDTYYTGGAPSGWDTEYWGDFTTYPDVAQINAAGFGVQLVAVNLGATSRNLSLDHVQLKVYYSVIVADTVAVDTRAYTQNNSLFIKVNEKQLVTTRAFTQTRFDPKVTERIPVSTRAYTQTYFDADAINFSGTVAVDTKAYAQTFQSVNVNERIPAATKAYAQTFQSVNVNEEQLVGTRAYAQTFQSVKVTERIVVATKTFTQTFQSVKVTERIPVATKTFTQTLYAPGVFELSLIQVDQRTFTQTFQTVNVIERITVDTTSFVQTLILPDVEEDYIASADTIAFIQSLYAPTIIFTDPPASTGGMGRHRWVEDANIVESIILRTEVEDEEEIVEPIAKPTDADIQAFAESLTPEEPPLDLSALQDAKELLELEMLRKAQEAFQAALKLQQEEEEMAVVMTLAAYRRRKGFLRR